MNKYPVNITINGMKYEDYIDPSITLLQYIRENVGFTGTKIGCENGECGACTVLMDGLPVRSCIILAVEADGSEILTVEGLSKNGKLHPLQEAFVEEGAVQCGFCTPGLLIASEALLQKTQNPTKEKIYEAMGGHLCRCGTYNAASKAVEKVAEKYND